MTTDRAIDVINEVRLQFEFAILETDEANDNPEVEKSNKEVVDAFDMATKALKEVERYKKMIEDIKAEINSPNRNSCDYFIVDQIEKIIKEAHT